MYCSLAASSLSTRPEGHYKDIHLRMFCVRSASVMWIKPETKNEDTTRASCISSSTCVLWFRNKMQLRLASQKRRKCVFDMVFAHLYRRLFALGAFIKVLSRLNNVVKLSQCFHCRPCEVHEDLCAKMCVENDS